MKLTTLLPPEGRLLHTEENRALCATKTGLIQAMKERRVLEGKAILCDAEHNLSVVLGPFTGYIPRKEAALGIAEGTTREIAILSRVGKPISFTVEAVEQEAGLIRPRLSRRAAQAMALERLMDTVEPGMVLPATVTHLEPFGAFVDVGCGVPSMISIERISVSRIPHPDRRFTVGQEIFAVVLETCPELGRVVLSHRELLGTWQENAARFAAGMTVPGWVRGIKEYGVFVELSPNLSGLAEPRGDLHEGDRVSVYIKAIFPERMKIKLLVIEKLPPERPQPPAYFLPPSGRLDCWHYAPEGCSKAGAETVFR
ncbi:S1 RNA-binding domain-containing protein [uncultured Pseudoflavonifractor sp.]|uniref:S1 RNA-binding domain-containing protein n=1 Tax=uncultured Pseudoflavonifractor sp. TaxID=1221379 RepID=UPI003438822A